MPRELTVEEIAEIVASFGQGARRVRDAGFDLVELHAGHGYLVGQFLSGVTNRRGDLYGGELDGRQRFLREVVRSMRAAVGPDFPISVRLSGVEGEPGGITVEETVATARLLEVEGVALVDVSAGNHHTMDVQVQPTYAPVAVNAAAAGEVRRAVGIPVSVVGSIVDPAAAEALVARGDADFVRLGRPLLADPHYPRKVVEGRPRRCGRASAPTSASTAASRKRHVVCAVNYRTGREATLAREARSAAPLRVAVVGGGPAGIEAALAAAAAGHAVTLFERDRLGGAVNDAGLAEFKHDLLRYRDWLVHAAGELADVRHEEASTDELRRLEPDVVVLATGARPAADGVDLRAALARPDAVGERVVVAGGGQFAAEAAWQLALRGRRVTLAAPGEEIAAATSARTGACRSSPGSPPPASRPGPAPLGSCSPTATAATRRAATPLVTPLSQATTYLPMRRPRGALAARAHR